MRNRIKYLHFTLLFLTNVSCGVFNKDSSSDDVTAPSYGQPDVYDLQDPDCGAEGATGTFDKEVKIWISNENGEVVQKTFDLSNISRNGLNSAFIEKTVYTDKEILVDKPGHGILPGSRNEGIQLPSQKTSLQLTDSDSDESLNTMYFCRPKGGYDRNSKENVALATLIGIKLTYEKHQKLGPLVDENLSPIDSKLKKVNLLIHPKIFKIDDGKKRYKTNNAAWSNPGAKYGFYILVYPHSKDSETSHPFRVKFWEQPAIFSHEYGHHIFHHYGKKLSELEKNASKSVRLIANGLNEGFADLISLFTIRTEPELTHIMSMGNHPDKDPNERNPLKKNFKFKGEQYSKTFTYEMIDTMTEDEPAASTMWQEEHDIGSVVAHTINHTYDANSDLKDDSNKFKSLIIALDKLNKKYQLYLPFSSKTLLEESLFHFVEPSKPKTLPLTDHTKWIDAIDNSFPEYSSQWVTKFNNQ